VREAWKVKFISSVWILLSPLRFVVPLSEEEQRVLAEIERTFYEEDPTFVRAVRAVEANSGGPRSNDRPLDNHRAKQQVFISDKPLAPFFAMALVGGALMTFGYAVHVLVGFVGVCILFTGLLLVAIELRRRVRSSVAGGGLPLSVRLAARVDAQRVMRERHAQQVRQAQMRRNGQQPPNSENPQ
jgi:Protein of unknown function (DUF3040)